MKKLFILLLTTLSLTACSESDSQPAHKDLVTVKQV